MATPLLIDTDMGVDDAVAVALALASSEFDVRGIVGVGGNVELDQVMRNIGGLLAALDPPTVPMIGRGLDPPVAPASRRCLPTGGTPVPQEVPAVGGPDRREMFGHDGIGECDLPAGTPPPAADFREVYRQAIDDAGGELTVLATGPLSNLAAVIGDAGPSAGRVKRVCLSGGAVWTSGDAGATAEYNFFRDPQAAASVLGSRLPITVSPLDVSRLVCLDESHVARLAASGFRTGEVLARLLRCPLECDLEPRRGKTCIHDAVTIGSLLWPNLFLKTRMRLNIETGGKEAGRCRPALGGDKSLQIDLLTAVNAADFLEDLLESLCHEAFVV